VTDGDGSRLLIGFVGDDFTGSTDALESLTLAGMKTVLFTRPPTRESLASQPGARAFGVATTARSMSPDDMEQTLRPTFEAIARLRPRIVHYKVCSTFDSSPRVGSIGRAIDVGADVFKSTDVPVVAGAPSLGRYCAFGNLFARFGQGGEIFRLDRHPSMSRHPVTPMDESDIARHLARQTNKPIGLVDVTHVTRSPADARRAYQAVLANGARVVLIDLTDDSQLAAVGSLVAGESSDTRFVAGSSGVGSALTAYWRANGTIPSELPAIPKSGAAASSPVVVLSGSCSPVTSRQIEWALSDGFDDVAVDTPALVGDASAERAIADAVTKAVDAVSRGRHAVVHAALGPDDPRVTTTRAVCADADARIGVRLGRALRSILDRTGVRRVVIAGGDTSGAVARELGIESLTMVASLVRGAPLCRASAPGSPADGIEMSFKGGQVGPPEFFGSVVRGAPAT
jgi:3-oxoisoapionate kinase